MKPVAENEFPRLGRNEMAGLKGRSGTARQHERLLDGEELKRVLVFTAVLIIISPHLNSPIEEKKFCSCFE
jgi:hypothetical protein